MGQCIAKTSLFGFPPASYSWGFESCTNSVVSYGDRRFLKAIRAISFSTVSKFLASRSGLSSRQVGF